MPIADYRHVDRVGSGAHAGGGEVSLDTREFMALKGDLASVDLAQVFQMLALNQKVGRLSIQSPKAWKSLYFDQRGVTLYFNEHTMLDRVLAQLVRTDRISEDEVEEARDHAATEGTPVVDSLLASGILTEEDLDNGIRAELEEDLYDIFFWRDARFEFFEGASPDAAPETEGVASERFFFSTDMLIMEAARRIDEWSYIQQRVANALEIHRPVRSKSGVMEVEGDLLPIFDLIDGKRNVGRLIEITGLAPFHLYKGLASLIDQGQIELVPSEDILVSAKECFREGRLQDAINLFEKAISDGVGIPEAHMLVAEAYNAIGEHELANYHVKCVAECRIETGHIKEAVNLLRKVLDTIPTDLAARERIVELTAGHPELRTDDFNPLALSKSLVDLYLDIGELERVRSILEGLLLAHPDHMEFKRSLINVHSKAGDTKRVIELYESIADDLVRSRNPIEAIKYLQKILMLDRTRRDISERVKSLYQLDERRRSRRRRMIFLAFLLVLLVATAMGYVFYDKIAARQWAKVQADVANQVEKEHYEAALRLIDNFLSTYPYTMVGFEVKAYRVEVEVKKEGFDEQIAREEDKKRKELQLLRQRYQLAWSTYESEFKQGNLSAALDGLEQCKKLVFKAGMPKDYQWWREHNGEQAIIDLKNYMGLSEALYRRYRDARDEGNHEQARSHAIELCDKYELSSRARQIEVPVLIHSQPPKADIYRGERPLTIMQDGKHQQVHTPAVVYCPAHLRAVFELRKEGFSPTRISLDPLKQPRVTFKMSPTPGYITFTDPALTGCGAAHGRAAVGLRGGKVGIVWLDDPSRRVVGRLDGLAAVAGQPVVTAHHVIFASNFGHVVCHSLVTGRPEWEVKAPGQIEFDLVVNNDRVFVVNRAGGLLCLSGSKGGEIWSKSLDGLASGRPTTLGANKIVIGTQNGLVLVLNATNGSTLDKFTVRSGISSQVVSSSNMLVFGTSDGRVRGLNATSGAQVWDKDAGRAIQEVEIVASPTGRFVYHVAANNELQKRDIIRGTRLASTTLRGLVRSGPIVQNGRIYVVVREMIAMPNGKMRHHDLLQVFGEEDLELQWQFQDGGDFHGSIFGYGKEVLVTGSKGQVYRFK